jgi:hypothetical protein
LIHRRTVSFKQQLAALPESLQQEAKERFKLLVENPAHPQLHFKEFRSTGGGAHIDGTFSVRVNGSYRALGTEVRKGLIVWWFIGNHSDYMKQVRMGRSYKG